jgi:hypothetical protein
VIAKGVPEQGPGSNGSPFVAIPGIEPFRIHVQIFDFLIDFYFRAIRGEKYSHGQKVVAVIQLLVNGGFDQINPAHDCSFIDLFGCVFRNLHYDNKPAGDFRCTWTLAN